MKPKELMAKAIDLLTECRPVDPKRDPKVGAVIAIDGVVIAAASRTTQEHAEKLALSQIKPGQDLSRATVYTTLEPCTAGVRRREGDSCTQRLVRAKVKKVVVGILDPNQGVCGKGVLELQDNNIRVEFFPHKMAQQIRHLNDTFIQAQRSIGMRITSPENDAEVRGRYCRVSGTFINPPGDSVVAITCIDGEWWPQLSPVRTLPETDNEWEVRVNFGITGPCKIYIVRATDLGMEFIKYFHKIVGERDKAIIRVRTHFQSDVETARILVGPVYWPFSMATLPKGLEHEDCIKVNVVSLES